MSVQPSEFIDSPSKVGNFLISYCNEADTVKNIRPESLVEYLNDEANSNIQKLCETDSSFFPRAFTDVNLLDSGDNVQELSKQHVNDQKDIEKHSGNSSSENGIASSMAQRGSTSYQPDVILSNSHQRSGPDGSPSLATSTAQPFATNMSETGELFAPVRTLTFSDIDQSSHIEDSYMNSSRLVSTPNKNPSQYDYSSMHNGDFQTGDSHAGNEHYEDTSDSDENDREQGKRSPMFRQLEGEDDGGLLVTGPFHPSAHGLSKEFMDQFVGKTSQPNLSNNMDIFSPLGSHAFRVAERRIESSTPPLHSPGPNSPFAKYAKSSPRKQKSPYRQAPPKADHDPDEIQFQMSPTRTQPDQHPFSREVIGYGSYPDNSINYSTSRRSLPLDEMSFKPIDAQHQVVEPRNIPKNLNDYFSQYDKENKLLADLQYTGDSQHQQHQVTDSLNQQHTVQKEEFLTGTGDLDIASRQGDGSDSDGDESSHRIHVHKQPLGIQATNPRSANHDPQSMPKTQVSVKLPQATYDTISANTSRDEKFSSGEILHESQLGAYSHPDIAVSDNLCTEGRDDQIKHSPGKVMDLLQDQSEHTSDSTNIQSFSALKTSHHVTNKTKDNLISEHKHFENSQLHEPGNVNNNAHSKDQTQDVHREIPVSESDHQAVNATVKSASVGSLRRSSNPNMQHNHIVNPVTSSTLAVSTAPSSASQTQVSTQAQKPVSSRLFQETVSQRNKTTQKYVSNVPGQSKPAAQVQNKDFKKPFDVPPKNNPTANLQGAKKSAAMDNSHKFKVSDKVKPKFGSAENISTQKQRSWPSGSRSSADNGAFAKPRNTSTLTENQAMEGQGYRGHDRVEGQGHHIEDGGEGSRLVTQVQTTSPVPVDAADHNVGHGKDNERDTTLDTQGMLEVRHQLQNMMKMSQAHISSQDRSQYEPSDILAGFGMGFEDQVRHLDLSWNQLKKPEDDMVETFPSFVSQCFTDSGNVSRADASVHAENQRLRDMLEKERYRRKHCEQYIQQLNVKLLETQQQVAVAVATDKRKDLMIEQLDKQLARVMEGWKRKYQEQEETVEDVRKEKHDLEHKLQQQKQLIENFEADMSEAVDALRREKEQAAHEVETLNEKIQEVERSKAHTLDQLEAEREKVSLMEQECIALREGRETLDRKLDQMQRRLHREQDEWFQREQELLQRIEDVSEKNTKILQAERAKNEEQGRLAEEIMEQYQAAMTHVKKLEMDLDAALREKDSVKVEMSIMEAKFENTQRVLEADLQATMDKQIQEQVAVEAARHERQLRELQEKHREQTLELGRQHDQEQQTQMAAHRDSLHRKEEEARTQILELEARLHEYSKENAELKRSKQKLESTRYEILSKLQSQWNETLSMLSATPQRKPTQSRTAGATGDEIETNQGQSHQATPPRHTSSSTTNQTSPKHLLANQLSPIRTANQEADHHSECSPGNVTCSTEIDPDSAIEQNAATHLKQFQEYMNNFTRTPEWLGAHYGRDIPAGQTSTALVQPTATALTSVHQAPALNTPSGLPTIPGLTTPDMIDALLSAHLQNIQQQPWMPRPPTSINQSAHSISQPNSLPSNSRPLDTGVLNESSSHSLPPNLNPVKTSVSASISQAVAPASHHKSVNQIEISHSNQDQTDLTLYGDMSSGPGHDRSGIWGGANMSQAVAIRPPLQCDDREYREKSQPPAGVTVVPSHGYFRGGQSFSPPTKQDKDSVTNSTEDLSEQADRLTDDYVDLSRRLDQHESHQQDLQHYIRMLLDRSPKEAEAGSQNDSFVTIDNDEMDLNDTAQAAQLQREINRIQELRQKQETSSTSHNKTANKPGARPQADTNTTSETNKILNEEQLAEVTRLLNQVNGQTDGARQPPSRHGAVNDLLELLKNAQTGKAGKVDSKRGSKSPRSPAGHQGDSRQKTAAMAGRRQVQFNTAKGVDGHKAGGTSDSGKQERAGMGIRSGQPGGQGRKVERKVAAATTAGAAQKGDKQPKPAAWK